MKSRSPYVAPVVLVRKKDESFRLCIDYKGLNKITIKHKFLIPFIDEMLDELTRCIIFFQVRSKIGLLPNTSKVRIHRKDSIQDS